MRKRPVEERFWEKVDKRTADECWEWTAQRSYRGYGTIWNGRKDLAHRVSYIINVGKIPPGIYVCHRCDNRGCVNPTHLFLGTNLENVQDAVRKGRNARGESIAQSRITTNIALEIRRRFAQGEQQKSIARDLGVSATIVSMVCHRKTWRHLPAEKYPAEPTK